MRGAVDDRDGPCQERGAGNLHEILTLIGFPFETLRFQIIGQRLFGRFEEMPADAIGHRLRISEVLDSRFTKSRTCV
ncbi:hypothetical protein, partial [Novosphingobium sp.]|uniref:hypothetical protein n=1 Tax=Novosphingobium sp. TaxID=1874826 RepID=UPI002FE3B199